MMKGTIINVFACSAIAVLALASARYAFHFVTPIDALAVIAKLWALDLALLGAALALIYKLYDSAYVKGLSDKLQSRLRRLVNHKTRRLWILVASFALLIIVSSVPSASVPLDLQTYHARIAIALFVGDVLFFFAFVPIMWTELRDFQVAAKAKEDELAERKSYLDEWTSASSRHDDEPNS